MDKKIISRVKQEAEYIIESNETLRSVAKKFKVSKSTVHKDLSERLSVISPELAKKIRIILDEHIMIRHIKGGESTKEKYQRPKVIKCLEYDI